MDAVYSGGTLSGPIGNSFCYTDSSKQVLDTRLDICYGLSGDDGTISYRLFSEGSWTFSFWNLISNPACTSICPPNVVKSATIYAGGDLVNSDCNTVIGKGISVSNGVVYSTDTDFQLPGVMPLEFTRYYNSMTAQSGSTRGFGRTWAHNFDSKVDSIGTTLYKITNPDGRVNYYRDTNSDGIFEAVIPKGDTSNLVKNADNSFRRLMKDGSTEEFNSSGYLAAARDRNGNNISLIRDSANNLTTIIDPSGRAITINYDVSNRITQLTLPDGKTINYVYSGSLLQKVTYPDGTSKTFEYSGYNLTGIKNENGKYTAKFAYDGNGRGITSSADGSNEKISITYTDGTHSTITDSLGRVTTYTIDKSGGKGHLTDISGPGCKECGQGAVAFTYNDNLNVISSTDANGNITKFTYDSKGNVLTKTEGYGTYVQRTTAYSYEPEFNQITSVKDPKGNTSAFDYDAKGNLISITNADNKTTTLTRDTRGLITKITDADGRVTSFTYDEYGNNDTNTDSTSNISFYSYDIMGRLLVAKDANGNSMAYAYDERGRLTQINDSLNQLTKYLYDPAGNFTSLIDANGNQTQFVYDAINRVITEIDALGKQVSFTYDTQGNVKTRTDANLKTTNYSYDNYDRISTISYPDNTQITFTYDNAGNIIGASGPNISYTFSYNELNRNTGVTDSLNRSLNYMYDANLNKTLSTSPGGTTSYAYSSLNRLTSITDAMTQTYGFAYDANGMRKSLIYPNGVTTTYSYDSLSRLTNLINRNGSQTVSSYDYSLDKTGNRLQLTDMLGVHYYNYDSTYRLIQAIHPDQPDEQYTYDPVGNRQGTIINAANSLLADAIYSYSYDNNGNLIQKTNKVSGQITSYTYDYENRLVNVSYPGMTAAYKYDPFGRRIEKEVNGSITRYLYDREDVIAEYDGNNQIMARYTHGPGVDEPLCMERNGEKYYYHFDGLGSVTGMTEINGDIAQEYAYDSYGNLYFELDPNLKQLYTYTGRELDRETGLYYYRARYYDPMEGRFLTKDPIGYKGGINVYSYVENDPINWVDPWGLDRWHTPDDTHTVGRPGTIVPPGGILGTAIENHVGSGYTFGEKHDAFVDKATKCKLPDPIINIPTMLPVYLYSIFKDYYELPQEKRPQPLPLLEIRW